MNFSQFDVILQRLQALPPFTMFHPRLPNYDGVVVWFELDQSMILPELVIDQLNVPAQVDLCSAQIQTWGRYKAIAQRCVDIVNRQYRIWRDRYWLKSVADAADAGEKKPTKDVLEKRYRTTDAYVEHYRKIEQAQEALDSVIAIHEAFKIKANLLGAYAPMFREMVR